MCRPLIKRETGVGSCNNTYATPNYAAAASGWIASQIFGQHLARDRQVVVRLQVQPELGLHTEEDAQAGGGIGGDAGLAGDDFADAALRHANFLGQPLLRHAQRFEKFFQQDFAGGGV